MLDLLFLAIQNREGKDTADTCPAKLTAAEDTTMQRKGYVSTSGATPTHLLSKSKQECLLSLGHQAVIVPHTGHFIRLSACARQRQDYGT